MYLFSRRARLGGGRVRESVAWAVEASQKVTQVTGLNVGLWMRRFSPDTGTIAFSSIVTDIATLEAANDKMMVDDGVLALLDKGSQYLLPGSLTDRLATIVSGQPEPNRPLEYAVMVDATMAAGKLVEGIEVGVEIAQRAQKITGVQTVFLSHATGNYGGVSWLTGFANVGELERAQTALNSDSSFIEYIDKKAKGVYNDTPGASTQVIYRRIPT
jgi:hypothetical protein